MEYILISMKLAREASHLSEDGEKVHELGGKPLVFGCLPLFALLLHDFWCYKCVGTFFS